MLNRILLKKMKFMIFGEQSTGKTTLLTTLWNKQEESDKAKAPEDVKIYFERINKQLDRGLPVVSTTDGELNEIIKKGDLSFVLSNPDNQKEKITFYCRDYMGESAQSYLEHHDNEAIDQQSEIAKKNSETWSMLHKRDAILLLLDSYTLNKAESFYKYCSERRLFDLLVKLKRNLSDAHRGGLPVCICLTRTDLISSDDLNRLKDEANNFAWKKKYGIKPVVKDLSVFQTNKANKACTEGLLNNEYQSPGRQIDSDAGTKMLFTLYNLHRNRKKTFSTLSITFALIALAALVSFLAVFINASKSPAENLKLEMQKITNYYVELGTEKIDIIGERKVFLQVMKLDESCTAPGVTVFKYFSEKSKDNDQISATFDNFYVEHLGTLLTNAANNLTFNIKTAEWEPQEYQNYIEAGTVALKELKSTKTSLEIKKIKINYLQNYLKKYITLSLKEQACLADEYDKLTKVPDELQTTITKETRNKLIEDIAELYKKTDIDYLTLYETDIPNMLEMVKNTRNAISDDLKEDIEELIEYLDKVANTKSITINLDELEFTSKKPGIKVKKIDFETYFKNATTAYPDILIPTDLGWQKTVDFKSIIISQDLQWEPGQECLIKCDIDIKNFNDGEGDHDEWKVWSSRDYSEMFRKENFDIPGLGFLVFKDMHENAKKEEDCWFGFLHYEFSYHLKIQQTGVWSLFEVPQLLVDANEFRKKPSVKDNPAGLSWVKKVFLPGANNINTESNK